MSIDHLNESERNAGETVEQWVRHAERAMDQANLFFGHGTASALDEACWMVSYTLQWPPDFAADRFQQALKAEQAESLNRLLRQRIESRQPLAYLIGEAWFAGLRLRVNGDALIPRSPLAELIVGGMLPWLDLNQPLRVLEVGTGSGCIAAALAWHWPNLRLDATDVSAVALELAQHNVDQLQLSDRVQLMSSDVYEGLGQATAPRYDLIISNPPYVPNASMATLPQEYQHEPELALIAGDDGLDIVRRLVLGAADHLTENGCLLVEVGEAQAQAERWLTPVDPVWLEFEHGGEGVFLLSKEACANMQTVVSDNENVSDVA